MTRSRSTIRTGLLAILVLVVVSAGWRATPGPAQGPEPNAILAVAWLTGVVDDSADVGAYASLVLDVEDRPHISYFDDTNNALRVASYDGTVWQIESLDSSHVSACQTSLALDSAGRPHISYCGLSPMGAPQLKYAHHDGTGWQITPVSTEAATHTSLALDPAGRPHISYLASGAVRYAVYTGSDWSFDTAASPGAAGAVSLALDGGDGPHVSYHDATSGCLMHAYLGGAGWAAEMVDCDGGAGWYNSLALNSTDLPSIAYYGNGHLQYAWHDGTEWHSETADSGATAGWFASLALDPAGEPHIGYYQSIPDPSGDETLGQVRYARLDGADWLIETVDSGGDMGRYATLALDAAGSPHIGYRDATNGYLKSAEYDQEPPVITDGPLADPVTHDSARISWQTDEESDSLVRYDQLAGVLDQWTADPSLVLSHSVDLAGLEPSTLYHFVVESTDASGNTVTSPEGFFTTAATPDAEPPIISAPSLSAPEGPFGYHVLRVTASDNGSVERVLFTMDGALLGTAYSPAPAGAYELVLAAPHLGMAREEFYSEHQFAAEAYDHAGLSTSSTYTGIPFAPPLNGVLSILAPDPQHQVYAPGGTTPPGTMVEIEVYASEYEWDCFHLPLLLASDGDSGVSDLPRALSSSGSVPLTMWPPWCHEVERAVEWVKFLVDDVLQKISYPPSNMDLVHAYTWDAAGLDPGSHEIKIMAQLGDGSLGQRTRTVEIVHTEPQIDVNREIVRIDNHFRIRLLVENQGAVAVDLDRIVDNLTGFQAIQKPFDAIGASDDYYAVTTEYLTATRRCDVTVGLHQNTGEPLTLEPGGSVIVEYLAVPILYANPWSGQYVAGDELVQVRYLDATAWVNLELDRPTTHSFNLTPLATEVYGARAASDYLIVSNMSRLFAAYPLTPTTVNRLLSAMAELAQLKEGILGDATYAGTVIGPGQAILSYSAAYVGFLLDTWGQGMMGSDGVPGHHPQNGYVLLVGESEIVPARDLSKSDWVVRLSDLWYGDTDHDWPNPERVVGRIIGDNALWLTKPIEASINVHKGEPGYEFDRDRALVLAGTGDGRTMFEDNAYEVSQILNDEFNMVLAANQQALEDAGWNINDWLRANTPDQDVIYYRDHSSRSSWGDGSTVVDTGDFGGVDPIGFGSSQPFVFGCSCLSGNYDGSSMAEAFLGGGAAVYIGATEVSDRYWNNRACTKLFRLWVDSPLSIGQALRDTKRDVTEGDWWSNYEGDRWAAEYNLYGDPKYGGGSGSSLGVTTVEGDRAAPPATLSVVVPDYEVATIDGADYVTIPGGNTLFALGQPVVPIYTVETSIPAGYQVGDVTLTSRSGLTSGLGLNLPAATLAWDSAGALFATAEAEAGWWPAEVFDWEVAADPAGGSRLIVRVAPFYYNAATTEYKFYKDYEFSIASQATSVSIELLETDRVAYPRGDPVQVDLWLNNEVEAPQDVLVEAVIRSGRTEEVVDGLPLQTLTALTGLASYMAQWDSMGFEAGEYRLEVIIRDAGGAVLDREWTEFSIGTWARVYLPCVLRQWP